MRRVSTAVVIWLGVVCLAGWSPPGLALGLGPLKLNSALGEPLAARVTLTSVSPAERASLRVRLGDARAYERFGLQYAAVIEAIDVDVDADLSGGSRVVLELTSLQPIRTPLLELLVVVETERGRMLRQYTAFLSPSGQGGDGHEPATTTGARKRSVMPGDTLWGIAMHYKYADVSVDQMMVAIYQDNLEAFGDDISQLQVGSTLNIPASGEVGTVDAAQAHAQVARAQKQWLDRITRITLGNTPAMGADTGSGGGRLRLVVPQSFPAPGGATSDDRDNTDKPMPPVTAGRVGPGFGRLSPLGGKQSVATPFATNETPAAPGGPVPAARAAPVEAGVVAMAFGQLAMAPIAFPATKPNPEARPVTDQPDASAAAAQPETEPGAARDDAKPAAPATQADAGSGLSMHTMLWLAAALFLSLAAVLWLLFRRRPEHVALLAGLAASAPSEHSDEVGR